MKIRLQNKHIVIAVILLVAVVTVFGLLNRPFQNFEPNTVNITQNGETIHTFTMDDIRALPAVSIDKTIQSSSSQDESGVYTGVELSVLLETAGLVPGNLQQIIAKAGDGFTAAYSPDEVLVKNNILVVYAKDGQDLLAADQGGAGPFRIVVRDDPFGNRCTKYLNEIEVK